MRLRWRRLPTLVLVAALAPLGPAPAAAGGGGAGAVPGLDLVFVRGGPFLMGDFTGSGRATERPVHPVSVADFYIGRHEVTVEQFSRFVEATGYVTDAERSGGAVDVDPVMTSFVRLPGVSWKAPGFAQDASNPVVWVSWNDADRFVGWLARASGRPYRLPTEAEWEFAARERGRDLAWSGTADPERAGAFAWTAENSGGTPHPVGGKEPNALGLHDLTGNVWEWCLDPQVPYREAAGATPDRRGAAAADFRVLRGGSWRVARQVARTTYRNGYRTGYAHSSIGFRVAVDADDRL